MQIQNPHPEEGIFFSEGTLAEILALAKRSRKMVFIYCYSTNCPDCRKLETHLFPLPEVGEKYNQHFVNWALNISRNPGKKMVEPYWITETPTLLFLDEDGDFIYSSRILSPYVTNSGWNPWDKLNEIASKATDWETKSSAYRLIHRRGNYSLHFLSKYIRSLNHTSLPTSKVYQTTDCTAELAEWIGRVNFQDLLEDGTAMEVFLYNIKDVDSVLFQEVLLNLEAFRKKYPKEVVERQLIMNYGVAIRWARWKKEDTLAEKWRADFLAAFGEKAEIALMQDSIGMAIFQKDADKLVELAGPTMERYFWGDHYWLNDVARGYYEYVEDRKALEIADFWANRCLELIPDGYEYLLTKGLIQKKLGNKEDAIRWLLEAHNNGGQDWQDGLEAYEALEELGYEWPLV